MFRFVVWHFLIFALPVAIGLWLLSLVVRKLAIALGLFPRPGSLRGLCIAAPAIGLIGAIGQMLFYLLHDWAHLGVGPARYAAFAAVGLLTGLPAAQILPYTSRLRGALWGLMGGVAAEAVFAYIAARGNDLSARIAGEITLCAIIALAVRFPLNRAPRQAPQTSTQAEAPPLIMSALPDASAPACEPVLTPNEMRYGVLITPVENAVLPRAGRIRNAPVFSGSRDDASKK